MKKLLLLGLAACPLFSLAPQAQAGIKHHERRTAQIAWTSANQNPCNEPRAAAADPAPSAAVQDDAGLFRSNAERTMTNPG